MEKSQSQKNTLSNDSKQAEAENYFFFNFTCQELDLSFETADQFKSQYKVIKKIAQGGFSSIYKVKHKCSLKKFAAKLIKFEDRSSLCQILKEVQILHFCQGYDCLLDYRQSIICLKEEFQQLASVNPTMKIDTILNTLPANVSGKLYIITDLYQRNLEQYLNERNKILSSIKNTQGNNFVEKVKGQFLEEGVRILRQILEGLNVLHNQLLIIHKDLKPQNIFLTKDLKVKIGDLGIAERITHANAVQVKEVCGSYMYISPESQEKDQFIDCLSDIYSLGVIILQIIHPMPTAMELNNILTNAQTQKTINCDIEPVYKNLILGCLEKQAKNRPTIKKIIEIIDKQVKRSNQIFQSCGSESMRQQQSYNHLTELQAHQLDIELQ